MKMVAARSQVTFEGRFITKVKQQLHSRAVGFLLGAGSSHLNGSGYPLATTLWDVLKAALLPADRDLIQGQIDSGCPEIEEALDRLDEGGQGESQLRHRVASAIAEQFRSLIPPLDHHRAFVRGLSLRRERRIPIFSLNYDPMIERAVDEEKLLLADGFWGANNAFFNPNSFEYRLGLPGRRLGRAVVDPIRGIINLYKLHGSMGWFLDASGCARRGRPEDPIPAGTRVFMIPPHQRKAQDTGFLPYSILWSEFRGLLANDQRRLLNRLICIGYGMRDTHINPVLEAALARSNFTLIILAKSLSDAEFDRWKGYENVLIATETRCVLQREEGPGVPEIWSFEWLCKEVNSNA
jgi:hypothetical protein